MYSSLLFIYFFCCLCFFFFGFAYSLRFCCHCLFCCDFSSTLFLFGQFCILVCRAFRRQTFLSYTQYRKTSIIDATISCCIFFSFYCFSVLVFCLSWNHFSKRKYISLVSHIRTELQSVSLCGLHHHRHHHSNIFHNFCFVLFSMRWTIGWG